MFYKKTLVIILEFRVECRVGFVLVIGRQAVLQEIRKVHRNCDTSSWFHENWKGYHHRSIHVTRKRKQRQESLCRYASRDHDVRKIPEQWCALRLCGSKAFGGKSHLKSNLPLMLRMPGIYFLLCYEAVGCTIFMDGMLLTDKGGG